MRGYLFLIISFFFLVSSCKNKQKEHLNAPENALPIDLRPSLEKKPKMVFEQPIVYLGRITEGDSISYTFHFKNKGNLPLKILSVNASCGCTTPKWPREALEPGKSAIITAEYNSQGRPGTFTKSIFVKSNGGDLTLTISGNVVKEPEKPRSPIIIR